LDLQHLPDPSWVSPVLNQNGDTSGLFSVFIAPVENCLNCQSEDPVSQGHFVEPPGRRSTPGITKGFFVISMKRQARRTLDLFIASLRLFSSVPM
jgi:hypothetical protein